MSTSGFILWGTPVAAHTFILISPVVVEIFQSGPKRWTDRQTNRPPARIKSPKLPFPLSSPPFRSVSSGAVSSRRGGGDGGESCRAGQLRVWCGLQRCSHAQVGQTADNSLTTWKKHTVQKIKWTYISKEVSRFSNSYCCCAALPIVGLFCTAAI